MPDMQDLIKRFKELDDQLEVCIKCGMCQSVCPLYRQTSHEADVTRGKIALLKGLADEMFKNPKGVGKRLDRCLLCGSCAHNCPRKVPVLETFLAARKIIAEVKGLDLKTRMILKGLLAHPERFDKVLKQGAKLQDLITKPMEEKTGTSCAVFGPRMLKERHFQKLAKVPFHDTRQALEHKTLRDDIKGLKVALFTGCLMDRVYTGIAEAITKVCDHHGVNLVIPENQACCGIPATASGDNETFNKLVLHNTDVFDPEGYDILVTGCATCTYTIKKVWPLMYDGEDENALKKLSSIQEKTMDINQFITSHLKVTGESAASQGEQEEVTYHDPCHLKKSLGISKEPRTLLKAAGKKVVEMKEADTCCGMGGSFNLKHYDISKAIGREKAVNIMDTACDTIATGCPACMHQISDMLSQQGVDMHVKHPIEIYAESLENKSVDD